MTTTDPALKSNPSVTPYIDPEKEMEMKKNIITKLIFLQILK